ncbi:hypothetical protein TRAPUB_12910 [Trametes pubescens]|uniref:MIT domain-containing protein n=1 Tax=Trametes pubescens TaxID=154538 RepID=A0A1M2VSJ4_TRAPU|nr:hypothetical protein TRAPUB_12910 [Trametes pubescens]
MPPATPEATPQEAEAQYSKAANAELAKDYDRAFRQYAEAAKQFLLLSRQATEGRLRTHYRNQAGKALERAERIKAVRRDVRPVAKDEFSEGNHLSPLSSANTARSGPDHTLHDIVSTQTETLHCVRKI